ncbi:hypothetical protein V1264_000540 [Littorina saxatilis]|uniref:Uncharacterized protein n=1 Tax=Littorina saxatilis TaxID=31220 RepID=A0AAN9GPV0_9CAEN
MGVGEGLGEGAGTGIGEGIGKGLGRGLGQGLGLGTGKGLGRGIGEGIGQGFGLGTGSGTGEGEGEGRGEGRGKGDGGPLASLFWLLILLFLAWPIASCIAWLYVFLIPFSVCIKPLTDVCAAILKLVQLPLLCATNLMAQTPLF